jgi:L-alanine-DL-glutamate epimerase-like enolase superfamily enzyme
MNGLPTSITIGIKGIQDTLNDADEFRDLGFRILKIKTGLHVEEDIEKVTKLRERFGNHFVIRVDANQGYALEQLKLFINATKNQGLELIEQPLPVGKEKELMQLNSTERELLAADESLKDPEAALKLAHEKPFGIYNIKLMKCGGILGAREIATIAEHSNTDLFWGCNDESIISITAALHVAYSSKNTKYIDLDGSFDLAEDLVSGGFELKDGYMYINSSPGFGFNKL